jgi:hypothetical protein
MIVAMLTTLPVLMAAQTFVQATSNVQPTTTNSIQVTFASPQTAGNLNVVVIGWADTGSTVQSVVDSEGNVYFLAAGTNATTTGAPGASQAVYYAKNIKGDTAPATNAITVTFNQHPKDEDVRILEYSGLDKVQPLDTNAGNSGIGTPADSSGAITNSATDLLIGAGTNTGPGTFSAPGSGYASRSFPGGYGDIVEDENVTATGSYSASAMLINSATTKWVMQMVAFRAAGQGALSFNAPTITSLNGSTAADTGGDPLTITGTNFVAGATVVFSNGTTSASAINCSVASATTLNCRTPAFPLGPVDITVTNVDGKSATLSGALTIAPANPQITKITVVSGNSSTNGGTKITITGSDFADGASVTVGGVPADQVSVESNTITCSVPANSAGPAEVVVTNPGGSAATLPNGFTYFTGGGISFVQAHSGVVPQSGSTAGATYTSAQLAGDLNVVVISWADNTAQVQKVTDSAGNTYFQALNPVVISNLSQVIYYAKNIKASGANGNTVTVTFSASATTPDVRVLEYAGIDPVNTVDMGGVKSASSPVIGTTADSGPFTTTFANDLVIAAVAPSTTVSAGGPGFITVSLPSSGDYVEHTVTSTAGPLDAQATLKAGAWVIQTVAFRESAAASQPNFTVSASPDTISVSAGSSASYTITVTPQNGFSSAVKLSASCPPNVQITCTINPGSVTPGSTSVTATLTVATTGASAALFAPQGKQLLPLYALFLPLPGIAFIGAGWAGSRKRKLGIGAGIVLMFLLLLLLLGCGGGGSSGGGGGGGGGNGGTPAGTYNITITATSGSVSHTATAAVTVQ